MSVLRVSLFRTLQVITEGGRPLDLGSPTTRSLFAYLVLNRQRPSDRRRLAFSFWPRGSEAAARRNLRQYLHRLRRILEQADPHVDWLHTDGNEVQFNPQAPIWLDVDVFRQAAKPSASLAELQVAVSLYTGDLLEDIYDDWCQEERQRLRQICLEALDRLCRSLQEAQRLDSAIQYTQRWIRLEPLDEAAHRRLLILYGLKGDRSRAVQHYASLTETLRRELETDPLPETAALFQAIQSGNLQFPATAPLPGIQSGGKHPPERSKSRDSRLHASAKSKIIVDIPMVGREAELTHLDQALQASRQGQGRFILVTGESGIGKTRLVEEYLDRCQGLPVLHNTCHELESVLPYAAIKPILHQALDLSFEIAREPSPAWVQTMAGLLPRLGEPVGDHADHPASEAAGSQAETVILDLLTRIEASLEIGPLQIVLDDLHWADTPTWGLLARLARHAAGQRWILIGLCRLEDLPVDRLRLIRTLERNDLVLRLPLERLSVLETKALAAHLLPGQSLDSFFLHRLYQETEGNPFFVIAILRALSEASAIPGTRNAAALLPGVSSTMPLSIQRVIEARLDRLTQTSQELLAGAAAVGRAFSLGLLEEISQRLPEEIVESIEEWQQRGLVREGATGYDFSHDKIRQVAYASLSRARRQVIHRRIAEVLEHAIPSVEDASLAHHYARSDQPLKALPYLTRAGEQALQSRAYLEARSFGQQAVSLLGQLPGPRQRGERIDLSLQLAQAYAFTGDLAHAQEILAETESLALSLGDEPRLGTLFHRSAQIFWLRGQPEVAGDYARRLLRLAEEHKDPRLLQASLRMLGRVSIALAAFDDAIAYLVRYTNQGASPQPPADLPIVLGYLGVAYSRVGSWSRALDAARSGLAMAEATAGSGLAQPAAFARMQLGFVYAGSYDWQSCQEILQEVPDPLDSSRGESRGAAEGDEELSLTPLGFMLLGLRGLVLAHLERPGEGIRVIRPALAWADRSNYRVFHYLPRQYLAEALLLDGQLSESLVEVERALEQARLAGNRWAAGVCLRLLAEVLTRQPAPNWPRIESCLIESMQLLRQVRARPDLARTYLALRRLYDRAGQIAWAVDCHFRATSIFEELGMADELRQAQGQAARERRGARVIPGLALKGPNVGDEK